MYACHAYLQGLLGRAARLLLQLPRVESFDVFVTLCVTVIQQVLFSLQQTLAGRHVTDADGKAAIG